MQSTLVLLTGVLAIPLAFWVLRAVFAWRYRQMLRRATLSAGAPASETASEHVASDVRQRVSPRELDIRVRAPTTACSSARARLLRDEAALCTRHARIALLLAYLAYAIFVHLVVLGSFAADFPLDAKISSLFLLNLPIMFLAAIILAPPARWITWTVFAYVLAGLIALLVAASPARALLLLAAQAELFLILPIVGLAVLLMRRLRPLLVALVAVLLYLAVVIAVAVLLNQSDLPLEGHIRPSVYFVAAISIVIAFVGVRWLLARGPLKWPIIAVVGAFVAALAIMETWDPNPPLDLIIMTPVAVFSNVLQILLVWCFFRLAVLLHDRHLLPAQLLHSHVALVFYSAYLMLILSQTSAVFRGSVGSVIGIAAAFACYAFVLHLLMRRVRRRRWKARGKRLLLLRAFGAAKDPEQLLDSLEDSWKRIGAIDLIAGDDLALHTIGARMLGAFLVRRADEQFIRSSADISKVLRERRSVFDGDARYPTNEIYCNAATWKQAFEQLAIDADAVLMDMRGFTSRNRGCVFELTELIADVSLARVVIVADRTTDWSTLKRVAREAWASLPAGSPNWNDLSPELLVLDCGRAHRAELEGLCMALLEAASTRSIDAQPLAPSASIAG